MEPKNETAKAPAAGQCQAEKARAAQDLVREYTMYSMGAGLVPLPVVDFLAVGGLQARLISKLCDLYGIEFAQNLTKNIVASLMGGIVPASISSMAASLVKIVPFVGWYLGAAAMPALSGASTYAMGQLFVRHFECGGTLLDFDAGKFKECFVGKVKEAQATVAEFQAKEAKRA